MFIEILFKNLIKKTEESMLQVFMYILFVIYCKHKQRVILSGLSY